MVQDGPYLSTDEFKGFKYNVVEMKLESSKLLIRALEVNSF